MKKNRFVFLGDCINSFSPKGVNRIGGLLDMKSNASEISRGAFVKKVKNEDLMALSDYLGYVRHHKNGMTMAADTSICYFRSSLFFKQVIYMDHSSVFYIFAEPQSLEFIRNRAK